MTRARLPLGLLVLLLAGCAASEHVDAAVPPAFTLRTVDPVAGERRDAAASLLSKLRQLWST